MVYDINVSSFGNIIDFKDQGFIPQTPPLTPTRINLSIALSPFHSSESLSFVFQPTRYSQFADRVHLSNHWLLVPVLVHTPGANYDIS